MHASQEPESHFKNLFLGRDLSQLAFLLEAVIEGAAVNGGDLGLLDAIYSRLYTLIRPRDAGKAGKAIVAGARNAAEVMAS